MEPRTTRLAIIGALAALGTSGMAHANLLSNGDFEDAALSPGSEFIIGDNLGKWITYAGQYSLSSPGPSGSAEDDYAKHNVGGGGQDEKLVQFVSAAGLAAGSELNLNFDYIYDSSEGTQSNPKARLSLIGISSDRSYRMYAGSGTDGYYSSPDPDSEFGVYAPGDVLLAQAELDFTNGAWAVDQLLSATLGQSFFAFGVILQSGCYVSNQANVENCNHLRGVDNFSLSTVPEPGTLALLGLGLVGLGLSRRRKAN